MIELKTRIETEEELEVVKPLILQAVKRMALFQIILRKTTDSNACLVDSPSLAEELAVESVVASKDASIEIVDVTIDAVFCRADIGGHVEMLPSELESYVVGGRTGMTDEHRDIVMVVVIDVARDGMVVVGWDLEARMVELKIYVVIVLDTKERMVSEAETEIFGDSDLEIRRREATEEAAALVIDNDRGVCKSVV